MCKTYNLENRYKLTRGRKRCNDFSINTILSLICLAFEL